MKIMMIWLIDGTLTGVYLYKTSANAGCDTWSILSGVLQIQIQGFPPPISVAIIIMSSCNHKFP